MATKYCHDCKRNVTPTKQFNWLAFIFLCGLFYLPVYILKRKRCPLCNGTNFGKAQYWNWNLNRGSVKLVFISPIFGIFYMKKLNRKQRIRWEMLLSHHAECDYDRTCLIFGIRVCSRCMGILAGSFFGAFFAKYFTNVSYLQNCACFAGLMLPAGIDFTVHELVTKYKSSNLIRFISGFIFGIALGNSFVLRASLFIRG